MAKANNPLHVFPDGKITFQKLASRFSEAVIKWLDGDKGSILQALTAALRGRTADAQTQAFGLIVHILRTYSNEFFERYFESELQQERKNKVFEHTLAFHQSFLEKLDTLDIYIDKTFVEAPLHHPTTAELHRFFSDWIVNDLKLTEDAARIATSRFPRRLLGILAGVARNEYAQLFDSLETPFYVAEQKAQALDAYQDTVAQLFDRPAFTDPRVRLADMYVQPFFRYFKPKKEKEEEAGEREGHFVRPKPKYHLIELAQDWLSGNCKKHIPNADARILLLLGQPGQGKSSFTYFISWYLLAENPGLVKNVFLLRLRDFENSRDFLENPLNVATQYIEKYKVRTGFTDQDLQGALLILDGLDEYYMNNGLKNEDIDTLLNNLHRDMRNLREQVAFHCLITSRTNYVRLEHRESSKDLLIADLAEMEADEQLEWLERYRSSLSATEQASKAGYLETLRVAMEQTTKKKKETTDEKILALLRQPILLRVMVEAEANPFKGDERVTIYKNLFDHLINRKWSADGQLKGLEKITAARGTKLFRKFLQAFALHIFYEEKEYARRSDFEEKPLSEAFEALKRYTQDIEKEVLLQNLLISFYFKEVPKDNTDRKTEDEYNNYAYEFLHKSFQEYLIAEHIWEFFSEELLKRDEEEDDWKIKDKEALQKTFELFSPRILSPEITDYLYELAARETSIADAVFQRAKTIMAGLAEHSYLLQYHWKQIPKHRKRSTPLEQSLAVFYGLLSVNSAIVAQKTKDIAWPSAREADYESKRQALAAPLQFIPNTRLSDDLLLLLKRNHGDEAKLSLRGAYLSGAGLSGAGLSGADLSGTDLRGAYLRGAYLSGAYLSGASLSGADLSGASLSGASLSGASLSLADLSGANLFEADLSEANLSGADLSGANLPEADLSEANLSGADLPKADLSGTDLSLADLSGTNLSLAYLGEADLSGADLRGADLRGADLRGADLGDADLYGAKFSPDEIYGSARHLDKIQNLHLAKNLEHADWHDTIYEGFTAEDWARFRKERAGQEDV